PTDPADMSRWESLLDAVQQAYAPQTAAFRTALDDGMAEFDALRAFCAEESAALRPIVGNDPARPGDPARQQLIQLQAALSQLAEQGGAFEEAVRAMRGTSPGQPIADDEGARSALVANHLHWSEQLAAVATLFDRWSRDPAVPEPIRRHAAERRGAYESIAARLRQSQDRLAQLPPLELSEIGRELSSGEAAIIVGPAGAAVVPSWQLFPSVSTRSGREGVAFDRRFRGEQVIAGAIRSLLEPMPLCVFVHAEERSLLKASEDRLDLSAAADALRSARFDVREWPVTAATRPVARPGQRIVWIVVPPLRRTGLEISRNERTVLERTRALVAEGQPVLLTVARSALALFRQEDPWSTVAADLGVTIDTGRVLFEWERVSAERSAVRPWQAIDTFVPGSVLASALEGQNLVLSHPMAIEVAPKDGVVAIPIARIEPSPNRWLERDWRQDGKDAKGPPAGATLENPVNVVVAIERPRASEGGTQRLLVVGSGGWLLTTVMNILESLGGDRAMLTNPGNRELLLSGVTWLAGLDDWIAPGPTGREVERLSGITPTVRRTWLVVLVAGMPLAILGLAALVALRRRSG
ncbi:MAG: hypothetical protein KDA22_08150, partial [Phycisphaerales bacterium]|nr:hypothetical protein [Phycisphaerales bacterium]